MTRALFLFGLLIYLTTTASQGQLVSEKFTENVFSDNFDSDNGLWKIMSNADNLFLIQEGKYILQRKHTKSAYSVFPKWANAATTFELTANFSIESTEGIESGAGLIFMAQADGSGAFVLEINDKKQYRLKQLVGVNFKLLTGNLKTNGWVDSPVLNGNNQTNLVEVRSSNRNYDIYLNQSYVLSFTELAYKTGNIGISVGATSKFTVDEISVYTVGISNKENIGLIPDSKIIQKDSLSISM